MFDIEFIVGYILGVSSNIVASVIWVILYEKRLYRKLKRNKRG